MKFPQLFGIVICIHLILLGLLLFQPGCQTAPDGPPSAGSTAPATRPAPATSAAPAPRERSTVDPAFNAGLSGTASRETSSSSERYPPTRPSEPTAPAPVRAAPEGVTRPEPTLQPMINPELADEPVELPPATIYTVVSGDTLGAIARRHGVSVAQLKSANGLSSDLIRVGDELVIPGVGETVRAPAAAASASSPPPASPVSTGGTYTVAAGDTLGAIARRYGLTVGQLKAANGLSNDLIRVGQELVIPTTAETRPAEVSTRRESAPAPVSAPGTYTVVSGDTLGKIASRFGVTIAQLRAANGLRGDLIRVGQVLQIPGQAGAASAPASVRTTTTNAPRVQAQPSTPQVIGNTPAEPVDPLDALDNAELEDIPMVPVDPAEDAEPAE